MSSVANVVDGELVFETTPTNTSERKVGENALGKDAFMTLLVAQMQNQDPLNPSSDTEWISQLAQFSSLEMMENLNTQIANQSALGLVGKNVIVNIDGTDPDKGQVAGYVQFVELKDGKAYLSINDEKYPIDNLQNVIDDAYLDAILNGANKGENTDNKGENTEDSVTDKTDQ